MMLHFIFNFGGPSAHGARGRGLLRLMGNPPLQEGNFYFYSLNPDIQTRCGLNRFRRKCSQHHANGNYYEISLVKAQHDT